MTLSLRHCCFLSKHMRLVLAFTVALWMICCPSTINGARRDSRISIVSTPLLDETRPVSRSSQDVQILQVEFDDDDTLHLSPRRDVSSDMLAITAIPVSSFSHKTSTLQQLHLENQGLHLRSSSRNVSGIAGITLPSLPIMISELADLLSHTRTDLQKKKYDIDSKTPFYQFNTTKWSFSVITANSPIRYTFIQAVVIHFLKLLPKSPSPSNDITSTRAGVILNGSIPVADVIIMPLSVDAMNPNHNHVPFSTFGEHSPLSSTQPIEITTVTPSGGSSCAYKIVNETAILLPFATPSNAGSSSLQPRSSPETEIFARVGRTAFAISFRLLLDRNGLPTEVKVSAAIAIVSIALWRIDQHIKAGGYVPGFPPDAPPNSSSSSSSRIVDAAVDENDDKNLFETDMATATTLDTEFFEISLLNARLLMQIVRRDPDGNPLTLALSTWKAILLLLADPLRGMNSLARVWGMEGDIYGPEKGDDRHHHQEDDDDDDGRNSSRSRSSSSSQVHLGQWELYFGSLG